ncbi:hypothetical protein MDAP_001361 [Mitosporidium daphniae]|uniref:Glucose-6-phosphate isomerase n=1 Tax=Mitosporidium daphniae TaxID=1485682 RepID=A0A098VM56_9MICR|nr:glucose-6-phosphate isomerase [Mitosporidium daphniae]XP_013236649.1 glucose-6-phosphate isomerase [Mitosporidium daphniae]KGG50182.1 glucose-6-phosphate isomerase [Mitosporidium daphniae]KGG50207.1 glucose-6-phosphate isomerase [Mitosporidium daphniae]|eukprot:XP_013236625.1 glucose-6-phosphate isomerase [Mitosporidium daphniae]
MTSVASNVPTTASPTSYPSWKILETLSKGKLFMPQLFHEDPSRSSKYAVSLQLPGANELYVDYSKNMITDEIKSALISLLKEAKIESARDAMFAGAPINSTEGRSVLHVALRALSRESPSFFAEVSGSKVDLGPMISAELKKMKAISDAVNAGTWLGHTGRPITSIVNIGIGGSDLGPKMVSGALAHLINPKLSIYYVSNVDGADMEAALAKCDPETTLFIIVSKTFTTAETMLNAQTARSWFLSSCNGNQSAIGHHFVAVSTNEPAVKAFGIQVDDLHIFKFWDWVGGRYSLWSAVGLSISIAIGYQNFERLLAGARAMDKHFLEAPLEENIPILMAALGIWYNNFMNLNSLAILPYEQNLGLFPKYLQQADMESNGKSACKMVSTGEDVYVNWKTGPVVWGEPGTNGQHAFYQLLHQGTNIISCDLIGGIFAPRHPSVHLESHDRHRQVLVANMLAQAEAMMMGNCYDAENNFSPVSLPSSQNPHKAFKGNRPTTVFLYDELTPEVLGCLIAAYEHKIFVQGHVWNINSYDQMGVELGKTLATAIDAELVKGTVGPHADSSTCALMAHVLKRRAQSN